MSVDRSYLDQIAALEFKGVEWTREKILEVRDLLSPWNHNIALPHGVYTAACDDYYPAHQEIMRVVRERLGSNFSGRRIVDIGCLEGYFSIECALQGAEVLGIDGKLLNVRKCEFVRSVLGVERATFALGDAMNVTRESSGRFDAVLALGLLYHLDDPYTFLVNMAALCTGFAVIDTHVALEDQPERIKGDWRPDLSELRTFTFDGRRYEGRLFREFPTGTARDVKDLSPTASLKTKSLGGSPGIPSSGCSTTSGFPVRRRSSTQGMGAPGGRTCARNAAYSWLHRPRATGSGQSCSQIRDVGHGARGLTRSFACTRIWGFTTTTAR